MTTESDEFAMRLALDQAHNALLVGEVPVGASCTPMPVEGLPFSRAEVA